MFEDQISPLNSDEHERILRNPSSVILFRCHGVVQEFWTNRAEAEKKVHVRHKPKRCEFVKRILQLSVLIPQKQNN